MAESHKVLDLSLADGRDYMLDRSYAAAARLNFQQYLWKESLQFNIHPSIQISEHDARIADVATGTAMWLIDLARELPKAQLDGFDISLAQAPHQQWLPANVKLRTWNIFDDVPDDLVAKYDIVHVRQLIVVVKNSDPRPIIRNLAKMLKPGGYLQWDDHDLRDTFIETVDSSIQTPALQEARTILHSKGRNDWTLQLDKMFAEEGLEDNYLYRYGVPIELARANSEQHLLVMDEFASRLVNEGNKDEGAKLYQLLEEAYQEILAGAALYLPRLVCVGRKAQ